MSKEVIIALIGIAGVAVGAIIQTLLNFLKEYWQQRPSIKIAKKRKELLKKMLNSDTDKWRNIQTLMRVIGANEQTTKHLLLEIGARGSERENDVWALVINKQFEELN